MVTEAMESRDQKSIVTQLIGAEILIRRYIVSQPQQTHLTCFDALLVRVLCCERTYLLFFFQKSPAVARPPTYLFTQFLA